MNTAARWREIQILFDELIDKPAAERAAHLERTCREDAELRAAVENLLAIDAAAGEPLLDAIGNAASELLDEYRDRLVGTRVGPYELKSVIGQGGMSTVYAAVRADLQYQQTVAVKVVHQTAVHPRLRARLRAERQILATLDHPSIARLIDSGELADGAPYLVMEFVQGAPADVHCDEHTLFIHERLELFLQICAAVQFAHSNLVVHRDIKPSNILVTENGQPKLLDFGIAKLLAPESMSHTVPVTRLQERVLTPENAAPEQILGRPITTATDIYALGILLYQLLSGRSPYRLQSLSQLQLERAICMDEPLRPSQSAYTKLAGESDADVARIAERRGLTPERLRARLAGDLDAVVALAMRKDPRLRYASVEAFADDVRRHLKGKPVLARQGDSRYRTLKYLRRNVLAIGLVSGALLVMGGIAGLTAYQNQRLESERVATAEQRDRAQKVAAFMLDVFTEADPFTALGRETTAKELLDRGASKITSQLDTQPLVRAELLESIGLAFRRQGYADRAVPLFQEAVTIRRSAQPQQPTILVATLSNLAEALVDSGKFTAAETTVQQALRIARLAPEVDPLARAALNTQMGRISQYGNSDPDSARAHYSKALAILHAEFGNNHLRVADSYGDLAHAAVWQHDYPAAEHYARQSLAIYDRTVSSNYPDRAGMMETLGHILTEEGRLAEAEPLLLESVSILRRDLGAAHPRVAGVLDELAQLNEKRRDFATAIEYVTQSLAITRTTLGENHYLFGYRMDSLGSIQFEAGKLDAAEANLRAALAVYAKSLQPEHLYVASSRQTLGEILLKKANPAGAVGEFRAALEITRTLAGPESWRAGRSEASLGWALIQSGDAAEGEPLLAHGFQRLLAALGAKDSNTTQASERLIKYYRAHRREAEAAQILAATSAH